MAYYQTCGTGTATSIWLQWNNVASGGPTAATGQVWSAWTNTTAGTTGSNTAPIWRVWNETTYTTNNTTPTNTVWLEWNNQGTAAVPIRQATYRYGQYVPPPPPTEEELRRIEEHRAREEERRRREAREYRRAERIAARLLETHLNRMQRRQFRRLRSFHCIAPNGTRYRVRHGWSGNVEEIGPNGKVLNRFCIHPRENVPISDNLLAQKLMLETDDTEFRRIANVTRVNWA
jgi:hypothetical protein